MIDPNIGSNPRKAAGACRRGCRPPLLTAVALGAAILGLAACGGRTQTAGAANDPTGCPRVAILSEAVQVVQFRPGTGRDLSDVTARGTLGGFEGSCEYDDRSVTVLLNLRILAERGPASTDPEARFRYFVAVTDPNRTILAKQVFDTAIPYDNDGTRGGVQEELEQKIPLPGGAAQGSDYGILVGFQLTPDQLQYNRR